MNRSILWLALVVGMGGIGSLTLAGCSKPCQTTSQCGGGDVCAGAICQSLSCDTALFAVDPKSGACTALSGCYLTNEQLDWKTCSQDPCQGLAENGCLTDSRCQPAYENPLYSAPTGNGSRGGPQIDIACNGGGAPTSPPLVNGGVQGADAPGVNNGLSPKHPGPQGFSCFPNTARAYAGCRAVPQIAPQTACTALTQEKCGLRRDCTADSPNGVGKGVPVPRVNFGADGTPIAGDPAHANLGLCFERNPRSTTCDSADALSCLTNPACQVIGSAAYCPKGARCSKDGGTFGACEPNDRLHRCQANADCQSGERCDNDEACIAPRIFAQAQSGADPVPGTGSCLGACVPTGCAGFGEGRCNAQSACNGGTYATVCVPKPYCSTGGGEDAPKAGSFGPGDPSDPGHNCGCEDSFAGCAPQDPVFGLREERSLLVRDPEIVSDPTFRIDNVLAALSPAGQVDAFVDSWLKQFGTAQSLDNGAVAKPRDAFYKWLSSVSHGQPVTAKFLATRFHTTSLVNRLDLASAGNCGEARVTFALSDGYGNGNQRMTTIVELKVPDDHNGCRTVAQKWGELSLIDDAATRKARLIGIYTDPQDVDQKALLSSAHLGQVRTNEFINLSGNLPWELREWHLTAQGMLALAPVKQTVSPTLGQDAALLSWVKGNLAAIKAGTVIVPDKFLDAASAENGGRLHLLNSQTDPELLAAEKALNQLSCAGCHLTETKSPFVHMGERLGKQVGSGFEPAGRAVIDDFLQKELPKRAQNLRALLGMTGAQAQAILANFRPASQARVH